MFKDRPFILLITLLIYFNITLGQTLSTPYSAPPEKVYFDCIDETTINVWYDYSILRNPKQEGSRKTSQIILQIGSNHIKSYDIYKKLKDSLMSEHAKLDLIENKEFNARLAANSKITFNMEVFHNKSEENYIIQKRIPSTLYEYEISPIENWKIKDKYKTLLGYKAQKAIVSYGGRKWTAWFTKEIPSSYGPYIFGGLPGLIIAISDSEGHYTFEMSGILKTKENIYKNSHPEKVKISEEEFKKTEKRYHKRPDLFIQGNTRIPTKHRALPYNPIEKM